MKIKLWADVYPGCDLQYVTFATKAPEYAKSVGSKRVCIEIEAPLDELIADTDLSVKGYVENLEAEE